MIYNISLFMVLYITIVPILGFLICLIIEYNIKNSFYKKLEKQMAELDEKYLISEIVNGAILKNKNILLSNKINLEIGDIDKQVVTDSKWTIFILNQIIQNSVKYMNKDIKTMKIYAEEKKEKVILYIQDNGMGVGKGEIARVYDKGFTGENGRILGKKSTGIGLYLCKKLCDRLGLGIDFNSQKDIGTEVKIIFPVGSYTNI